MNINGAVTALSAGNARLWLALAVMAAGIITVAAVFRPRRQYAPDRIESPAAPWKRRALAVLRPGPGWASRVRYGLTRAEWEFRVLLDRTDWAGKLLADLDAGTWEEKP